MNIFKLIGWFLLLITTAPINAQIIDYLSQWSCVYLVRSSNNKVVCFSLKDVGLDEKNKAVVYESIKGWAGKQDGAWIYGLKLNKKLEFVADAKFEIGKDEANSLQKNLKGLSLDIVHPDLK